MNPVYKLLATITFLMTLPFIIVVGIAAIWTHKKPTEFNFSQTTEQSNNKGVSIQ